ncbi:MAG: hypothetical protein C4519_00910 [Desulfobacteraceae bacterium]|nr:MAG: hypothetical protein C4519_00910 [Desulfobacteraceae bacterium]
MQTCQSSPSDWLEFASGSQVHISLDIYDVTIRGRGIGVAIEFDIDADADSDPEADQFTG